MLKTNLLCEFWFCFSQKTCFWHHTVSNLSKIDFLYARLSEIRARIPNLALNTIEINRNLFFIYKSLWNGVRTPQPSTQGHGQPLQTPQTWPHTQTCDSTRLDTLSPCVPGLWNGWGRWPHFIGNGVGSPFYKPISHCQKVKWPRKTHHRVKTR